MKDDKDDTSWFRLGTAEDLANLRIIQIGKPGYLEPPKPPEPKEKKP